MLIKRWNIVFLFLIVVVMSSYAQSVKVDSLRRETKVQVNDSLRVNAYTSLSLEYRKKGNLDSALIMAEEGRKEAVRVGFRRGEAKAIYYKGIVHMIKSEYDKTLPCFTAARDTFLKIGDESNYANILIATGGLYTLMGDQETALDFQLQALLIKQRLKDTIGMAASYNNIANIYHTIDVLDTALVYFQKALVIHEKENDSYKLTDDYYNIGNCYHGLGNDSLAKYYLNKSLRLADSLGYIEIGSYAYGVFASMHLKDGNLDSAEYYYRKALEISIQLEDDRMLAVNHLQLAILNVNRKNYKVAEQYFRSALQLARQIGDIEQQREITRNISSYFSEVGKDDSALVYFKEYIVFRDSLANSNMENEMLRKKLMFDFESQKQIQDAEQDAKDAITDAKLQQQKVWIGLGSVVLLLVIAFAWFLYNRAQVTRRQNILIQQQKEEVEKQRDQVELQSHEIQQKNKSITDSITYASRIQKAILPQADSVQSVLGDSFVLYQPKDIVSGDFFWITETNDHIFYATVDCTGHGVPGGFMSILGASLLNEIVNDHQVHEPSEVLNQMRSKVISALRQTGESGENKDGMDMVLCRVDKKSKRLTFSAANNPVWICRRGEITVYSPDKQPVGIGATSGSSFTSHSVALETGDIIYTFTDGFADQFGGEKGKKFKYKPLKELLKTNSALSMNKQHDQLLEVFVNWKGNLEQVDDVLVIGVRV